MDINSNDPLYEEAQMLQLSGIQHFMFCPRQWALIQIEQLWEDNFLTTEGSILHKNVDNPELRETSSRDRTITLRGLRLSSKRLGFEGIADAVEIIPYPDAPRDKSELLKSGLFSIFPVEYKRGHRKINDCDRLQLTAQAMILEEMFGKEIKNGAIFYWEERHREYIEISETLRNQVISTSELMHHLMEEGKTPTAIRKQSCKRCSLLELCLPELSEKKVSNYLKKIFDEEDT